MWWIAPVCVALVVIMFYIVRYSMRQAKLDGITKKYNLVSGKAYKIVLDNGKVYPNAIFVRIYDFINQHMAEVVKVNGKYKAVKANIGLEFMDKSTNKEIRIKAVLIRQITNLETGEVINQE